MKNHHIRYNAWYKIFKRWHQYYINRCIQRRENINPEWNQRPIWKAK